MKRFIPILIALIGIVALSPPANAKNPFAQDNLGHRWYLFNANTLDSTQDTVNAAYVLTKNTRDSLLAHTAALAAIQAAIADGTGEIDTTLENVRAAVATTLAAVKDGTGEIDTTLENVRGAVNSMQGVAGSASDSSAQATIYGMALGAYRNGGTTISVNSPTSGFVADTVWLFKTTGGVYIRKLGFNVTGVFAATDDTVAFITRYPATGAASVKTRINGGASNMNNVQVGVRYDVVSTTLTTAMQATAIGTPAGVADYLLYVPGNTRIGIKSFTVNAGYVRADMVYIPAEKGAYVAGLTTAP